MMTFLDTNKKQSLNKIQSCDDSSVMTRI